MSGTSSVPQPILGPNGYIAPAEPDVLVGVQADINAAFGGGLNPGLSTPQGQIATTITAIIGDKDDQFLALTQGVDPAFATGRMQDAIARIYFLTRNPALPTVVQALCTGLAGVVIPSGALAQSTDGNLYVCVEGGTVSDSGNVTLPFQCTADGPILCPIGALNTIYQVVPGWESITNVADGVVGQNTESRAQFELRRQQSVAANSAGALGSVLGAVLNVPNVLDVFATENDTGSPVTVDGVTLPARSLYVCVAGGDPQLVANAIWSKKAPGCATAGGTAETVIDNNPLYSPPFPAYTVNFQTAIVQPFFMLVSIKNTSSVPSDALAQIQAPVLAAFSGADGGARARINSLVLASRYYAGIQALGDWAEIVNIKIGSTVAPTCSFTGSITGSTLTVTAVASGALAVGQFLHGAGFGDGVMISALGSGSGGTGTYTLNLPQTVVSESMVAVTPALDSIQTGGAHVPVLVAQNIAINLV